MNFSKARIVGTFQTSGRIQSLVLHTLLLWYLIWFTNMYNFKEPNNIPQVVEQKLRPLLKIKVVGVGGAGGMAVNHMVETGVDNVEFVLVTRTRRRYITQSGSENSYWQDTTRGLVLGQTRSWRKSGRKNLKKTLLKGAAKARTWCL